MKFTLDKDITYEQAVGRMFEMLGNSQIMALASSLNDYVMVRNVSCLFYDEKIYFKTDKNFRKTRIKDSWWTSRDRDLQRDMRNTCGKVTTSIATRIRRF